MAKITLPFETLGDLLGFPHGMEIRGAKTIQVTDPKSGHVFDAVQLEVTGSAVHELTKDPDALLILEYNQLANKPTIKVK